MKANELRTGNHMLMRNNEGVWYVGSVKAKDIETIEHCPKNECYQPIPLSEGWLQKFGFVWDTITWSPSQLPGLMLDGDMDNGFTVRYDSIDFLLPCHLNYVHQLQNLFFALTGKELKFKTT